VFTTGDKVVLSALSQETLAKRLAGQEPIPAPEETAPEEGEEGDAL
jgi:regulator of extracellular matrix RemA (YlzA/DUF370 family)